MNKSILLLFFISAVSCSNLYEGMKFEVREANSRNWDKMVIQPRITGNTIIVHFYSERDGKSSQFRNEFEDQAQKNVGIFSFFGVNCDLERSLCSKQDVNEYPVLKIYPPSPIPSPDVDRDLNIKSVLGKAAGYVLSRVQEVTDDNYKQVMAENPAIPKVLLFTDKPSTPILYKALSISFNKKMMLGIVRKENQDVYHQYNIKTTPKFIIVKHGEKKPLEYKGAINYRDIFDFLNIYSEQFVVGGGSSLDGKGDKPWINESVPELNSKSDKDICLGVQGVLCVIIFNNDKPQAETLDAIKEVRRQFDNKLERGVKFNYMWANSDIQKQWVELFEVTEFPTTIIFNPGNRKRYFKIEEGLNFNSLSHAIERITGGDARFTPIRGDIPSLE